MSLGLLTMNDRDFLLKSIRKESKELLELQQLADDGKLRCDCGHLFKSHKMNWKKTMKNNDFAYANCKCCKCGCLGLE